MSVRFYTRLNFGWKNLRACFVPATTLTMIQEQQKNLPAGQPQDENFRTPLPFKTLATRAGFGWIGKSAALITKQFGNAIRLNGVLTDMPLQTGTPINESFCGECDECVKNCPGKAITGNSWSLNTDRDNLLNAFECKKVSTERGKIFNVDVGTCGICLTVCPWTKKYINSQNTIK